MKINSKALYYHLARHPASCEGSLYYQPPKDSPQIRHFKLVGNLLFHRASSQTGTSNGADDAGVLVIENCVVNLIGIQGQQSRKFSLSFSGEANKRYMFTAPTAEECTKWMTQLSMTSYQLLQAEITRLRQALKDKTGLDSYQKTQEIAMAQLGHKIPSQIPTRRYVPANSAKSSPKLKSKNKHGSTFYTGSDIGTVHLRRSAPKAPKSQFFAQLDTVKAPTKSQTLSNFPRSASSNVDEVRKAMTLDRSTVSNQPKGSAHLHSAPVRSTDMILRVPSAQPRKEPLQQPMSSQRLSDDLLRFESNFVPGPTTQPTQISCIAGSNAFQRSTPPEVSGTSQNTPSAVNDLIGIEF